MLAVCKTPRHYGKVMRNPKGGAHLAATGASTASGVDAPHDGFAQVSWKEWAVLDLVITDLIKC